MAKKRGLGTDAFFQAPPVEEPEPKEEAEPELTDQQKKIRERRARRATFDLPPEVRRKIADLSVRYGVPQSQIVTLLLIDGIERIEAGEIDPGELRERSTSPKFAYNLDLEEALGRLRSLG